MMHMVWWIQSVQGVVQCLIKYFIYVIVSCMFFNVYLCTVQISQMKPPQYIFLCWPTLVQINSYDLSSNGHTSMAYAVMWEYRQLDPVTEMHDKMFWNNSHVTI